MGPCRSLRVRPAWLVRARSRVPYRALLHDGQLPPLLDCSMPSALLDGSMQLGVAGLAPQLEVGPLFAAAPRCRSRAPISTHAGCWGSGVRASDAVQRLEAF